MKLLRLTIHNIASIGDAVLDFEKGPLAEDTLFLICGPLGSGKTTILDSICLALYNTTPRLQSASNETYADGTDDFKTARDDGRVYIGDSRMLMRRGSSGAYVELKFTDRNDNVLTALWSCSKARERADGKIQDVKWTLSDAFGNGITSKKSETEKEILSRIGLTFEQFIRTTMLAQGEFTRFLKAKDSDKSDILEKLTGTEIYSRISIMIQKTTAAKKEAVSLKEAEIKGISLLTDEERDAIAVRMVESGKLLSDMSVEEKHLTAGRELYDSMVRLHAELEKCSVKEKELAEEFRALSSGLGFMDNYLSRQESVLKETEAFIETELDNAAMYAAAETVKTLLSQAVKAENDKARYAAAASLAKGEVQKLNEALSAAKDVWQQIENSDAELRERLDKERDALAGMDMEGLMRQKSEADIALSGIKEIQALYVNYAKAKGEKERTILKLDADKIRYDGLAGRLNAAADEATQTMHLYLQQEKVYEAKKTACDDILKEIRSRLSEGDDCPLCGQKIYNLTRDGEFESLLEPERRKKEELWAYADQARLGAEAIKAEISELSKIIAQDEKEKQAAEDALKACDAELHRHRLFETFENQEDAVNAEVPARETVSRLQDRIAAALKQQKAVDELQKEKNESAEKVKNNTERAEAVRRQIAEKESQATASINSAADMSRITEENIAGADKYLARTGDWRTVWEADTDGFIASLDAKAKAYSDACASADKTRNNIEITKSVRNTASSAKDEIMKMYPGWTAMEIPAASKAEGLPERWNSLLAGAKSIYDERSKTENELAVLARRIAESDMQWDNDIDGITLSPSEISAKLTGRIEVLRAAYDDCRSKQGADSEKLANDDLQRERLGRAEEEAEKARIEYERWYRLYEIFGSSDGKKFRNIAQSYVLRQLLTGANEYLHQLTDRYELEAQPGSLTILLKDKEAGGVLRPTSTISGGESFLTSLALALGLSSLGSRAASMDILFIDEGFGTLDGTYLETVMNTLERLHQMGGRKVGIISHVESLKERLATQVQVVRVSSTLSCIEIKNIL